MTASVRKETEAASGSLRTQADDEGSWEVGQPNSTEEAAKQSASCGGGGGKEAGQREPAWAKRTLDTGPGRCVQ
jgi:hypothetical protein